MKFGIRKPSLKKSFSARTSSLFTRTIKRALIPGYGKKGIGWLTNPKKALYNRVYNSLTIGLPDVLKIDSHTKQSQKNSSMTVTDQSLTLTRVKGLKQCEEILQFTTQYALDESLNPSILNAISKIHGRINRYIDKSSIYQDDIYQYITKEIDALRQTAKRDSTKYECCIILDIIELLQIGTDPNLIIDSIKSKYPAWQTPIKDTKNPVSKHISIPKELQNNPDAKFESAIQKEIIYELAGLVIKDIKSIKFMNAWIKILSHTERYSNRQINLFDYLHYVLTASINQVKKETTKEEYREACKIIHILNQNQDNSVEKIFDILKYYYQ